MWYLSSSQKTSRMILLCKYIGGMSNAYMLTAAVLLRDESTITTTNSTVIECRSSDSSICSGTTTNGSQRLQKQPPDLLSDSGSLFVTSPPSFLLGAWDSKTTATG